MFLGLTFKQSTTLAFSFLALSGSAFATPDFSALFNAGDGKNITFGTILEDPSVYSRNENLLLTPASNLKILTSYTALKKWGPDYRFTTSMIFRETDHSSDNSSTAVTNLTIVGVGDPTWGMSEFQEDTMTRVRVYAKALKDRGVKDVYGKIIAIGSDPRFAQVKRPKGWQASWADDCMAAVSQAFNVWANCGTYAVTATKKGGWVEPGITIPVKMNVKPGTVTNISARAIDTPNTDSASYEITGTLRANSKVQIFLPIHNTVAWVQNLLKLALQEQGIAVHEDANVTSSKPLQKIDTQSVTLAEILNPFMKNSLNFVGEALIQALGAQFGPTTGTLDEAGDAVILNEVSKIMKLPDGMTLADGCGLSYNNRVTANVLFTVLKQIRSETFFSAFYAALPIAGVDGTLKDRMKSSAAAGILRAKTGTLAVASSLSGYIPRKDNSTDANDYLPFVILSDTSNSSTAASRSIQDQVGIALSKDIRN